MKSRRVALDNNILFYGKFWLERDEEHFRVFWKLKNRSHTRAKHSAIVGQDKILLSSSHHLHARFFLLFFYCTKEQTIHKSLMLRRCLCLLSRRLLGRAELNASDMIAHSPALERDEENIKRLIVFVSRGFSFVLRLANDTDFHCETKKNCRAAVKQWKWTFQDYRGCNHASLKSSRQNAKEGKSLNFCNCFHFDFFYIFCNKLLIMLRHVPLACDFSTWLFITRWIIGFSRHF